MMNNDATTSFGPHQNLPKNKVIPDPKTIAVYTTLIVLSQMKQKLGIEAMVSFLERYIHLVQDIHPEIKDAVNDELRERALVNLYLAVDRHGKN